MQFGSGNSPGKIDDYTIRAAENLGLGMTGRLARISNAASLPLPSTVTRWITAGAATPFWAGAAVASKPTKRLRRQTSATGERRAICLLRCKRILAVFWAAQSIYFSLSPNSWCTRDFWHSAVDTGFRPPSGSMSGLISSGTAGTPRPSLRRPGK